MLYNLCGPKLCIVIRTATIIEKCIEKKKKRLNSCIPTWKFCLSDELAIFSLNLCNNTWWHLQYIIAYIIKRSNLLTSPTLLVYSISYFFFNYHPLPWRCCLFFIIVHCFKIFGFLCKFFWCRARDRPLPQNWRWVEWKINYFWQRIPD